MICYKDMTFCTRSDDCAIKDCFRQITQEVRDGAKRMGLGLGMGDMSQRCETGFVPKARKCPGCGWRESSLLIERAETDFNCAACGMHKLSEYIPLN